MTDSQDIQYKKALLLLSAHLPSAEESSRKPLLDHDIRVSDYLKKNGYTNEIILAGLLHDAIEWSDLSEQDLRSKFGDTIAKLVSANSKNDSIADPNEKTKELITRCIDMGQDALIIKAADILDSFAWYEKQNNIEQLKYCVRNAEAICTLKPDYFDDNIFNELLDWKKRFDYLNT